MIDRDAFEAAREALRDDRRLADFLDCLESVEALRARLAVQAQAAASPASVAYRVLLLKLEDALRRLLLTWPTATEGELGAMFGEIDALLEGLSEQMAAAAQPAQEPAASPLH